MNITRAIEIPGRWLIHSYYTLCPYASDGSGRLLLAGADLATRTGKVFVLDRDGGIIDEFGEQEVESGFFHTGFWQTWSPDCRYVYYQSGSLNDPSITRRELASSKEITVSGDAEGAPPDGEPLVSGLMGMIYAAGYGYNVYNPALCPVPFEKRDAHGLFEYTFEPDRRELKLSVDDVLSVHPKRDKLLRLDQELSQANGTRAGLTLMTYCVRWNRQGTRFMFYFGNHCVVKERGEPHIACLFTCNRDFSDLRLALDMSDSGGIHWSWHPDGEHLIGYGNPPDNANPNSGLCVSTVRYDGTGFRKLCSHYGSGHPSISPSDYNQLVTDDYDGNVVLWDIENDKCMDFEFFPARNGDAGYGCFRNEFRVCHHPVFNHDGSRFLFNVLDGVNSLLYEAEVPERHK